MSGDGDRKGPLAGYRVIELGGIGPAPMGGMMLADLGAEVLRVDRPGAPQPSASEPVSARGKRSLVLNLKDARAVDALLTLIERADVLIDPFRPGVCEKLGIGPEPCLARNPRLVFARMTGWGQDGPLAQAAGHDINYIALSAALHGIGRAGEPPVPPLNLVGDMGGGGMLLVNGVLAALLERARSGRGQVVDVAMVDGAAQLMWLFHSLHALGLWDPAARGGNLLDGGAPFYDCYECADGNYIALGAIEPEFFALLCEKLGIDAAEFGAQLDQTQWSRQKALMADLIRSRTREQWCELLEGSDACFAPVLTFTEAPEHPAQQARGTYIDVDGLLQPAPAPRFSRTPSSVRHGPRPLGADTRSVLASVGIRADAIDTLEEAGCLG